MRSFVPAVAAVALTALFAPQAPAQALYLCPDVVVAKQFVLIFSSTPLTALATTTNFPPVPALTAVTDGDKRSQVSIEKGDGVIPTAKTAADTVFASADYGVSNRGEGLSVLVRYHTKCQPVGGAAVGLPVEIVAESVKSGVAFVATAGGKPLKGVSVSVFEPGATDPTPATTDADGRTPTYSKAGRYAVKVGRFEKKKGEHEGRAYTGIWEYSTLVTDVK
jgi:hypothetical protein